MCIGLPMQVVTATTGYAQCEGMGIKREVDTLLVGDQPPGTWFLVFLTSAREILTEENAMKLADAVRAVDLVMNDPEQFSANGLNNDAIDALFADLIDREPEKPPSLIAFEKAQEEKLLHDQLQESQTGD